MNFTKNLITILLNVTFYNNIIASDYYFSDLDNDDESYHDSFYDIDEDNKLDEESKLKDCKCEQNNGNEINCNIGTNIDTFKNIHNSNYDILKNNLLPNKDFGSDKNTGTIQTKSIVQISEEDSNKLNKDNWSIATDGNCEKENKSIHIEFDENNVKFSNNKSKEDKLYEKQNFFKVYQEDNSLNKMKYELYAIKYNNQIIYIFYIPEYDKQFFDYQVIFDCSMNKKSSTILVHFGTLKLQKLQELNNKFNIFSILLKKVDKLKIFANNQYNFFIPLALNSIITDTDLNITSNIPIITDISYENDVFVFDFFHKKAELFVNKTNNQSNEIIIPSFYKNIADLNKIFFDLCEHIYISNNIKTNMFNKNNFIKILKSYNVCYNKIKNEPCYIKRVEGLIQPLEKTDRYNLLEKNNQQRFLKYFLEIHEAVSYELYKYIAE